MVALSLCLCMVACTDETVELGGGLLVGTVPVNAPGDGPGQDAGIDVRQEGHSDDPRDDDPHNDDPHNDDPHEDEDPRDGGDLLDAGTPDADVTATADGPDGGATADAGDAATTTPCHETHAACTPSGLVFENECAAREAGEFIFYPCSGNEP